MMIWLHYILLKGTRKVLHCTLLYNLRDLNALTVTVTVLEAAKDHGEKLNSSVDKKQSRCFDLRGF